MSHARTTILECDGPRGLFEVLVHPMAMTTFYTDSVVLDAINPSRRDVVVERAASRITVQPRHRRKSFLGNLVIVTKTCQAAIVLRLAKDPDAVPLAVDIRQRDEVAAELARIHAAEAVRMHELGEMKQELERKTRDLDQKEAGLEETITTELLLQDNTLRPVLAVAAPQPGDIRVGLGANRKLGDAFFVAFEASNGGRHYGELDEVRVIDAAGERLDAEVIDISSPEQADGGSLAVIPPGGDVNGVIKLPDAAKATLGLLTFQFFVRGQAQPLLLKLDGWSASGFYYPPTQEELDRKKRDEREKGKVSLHLQGVYGAIWLGDGIGLDRSEVTSMTGLGVRARYAYNRYWAVEGEVLGARTGTARFDDVTYEGVQGALARSGSLGRVQFGGVFRLGGDRYVPILRLGAGGQGGSHAATFNGTDEPDLPFDFSALWYIGAGLDIRLGDHFLAGIALTIENMVSSASELSHSTVEAGLHLGYSWKP